MVSVRYEARSWHSIEKPRVSVPVSNTQGPLLFSHMPQWAINPVMGVVLSSSP